MSYLTEVTVEFCGARERVYEAFCQLERHPEWNSDMTWVSDEGRMREGLVYETRSHTAGRRDMSKVEVIRMVPNERIELQSIAGIIAFTATFVFTSMPTGGCAVTCHLSFDFRGWIMDLARPIIELMARDRVRGNLENLARIMCHESKRPV